MQLNPSYHDDIKFKGFTVAEDVFSTAELNAISAVIDDVDQSRINFRKTTDLFAIRRFLKEVPEVYVLIFNPNLKYLIKQLFGEDYFVVKSIYFDKPESSNWFVAWHQDLTISVDQKSEIAGYGPWTVKPGQFAVQPPLNMLRENITVRIHLDDTDEQNGALNVVSGTHTEILRINELDLQNEVIESCKVKAGGVMLMRPLLMHTSSRTTNNKRRRVIHIELSRSTLSPILNWAEKELIF